MEGPVKERLTGALILVAVLVIVVPEMLSGPDPEVAGDQVAPAQAADAGPPMRTYSMVLSGSEGMPESGQSALTPQSTVPVAVLPEPAPQPEAPVIETTPAVAAVAPAPEPEPEPPVADQPAGKWWTQLGSFSARENADRLAKQLRAAGYSIDVTKVNAGGKELYRVRAGPERTRVDAQALQARLTTAGHKSTLVAP